MKKEAYEEDDTGKKTSQLVDFSETKNAIKQLPTSPNARSMSLWVGECKWAQRKCYENDASATMSFTVPYLRGDVRYQRRVGG